MVTPGAHATEHTLQQLVERARRMSLGAQRARHGARIPAQVRGHEVGIWGPGYAGRTVTGPTVWVPGNRLEEARELRVPFDELGIQTAESEESD